MSKHLPLINAIIRNLCDVKDLFEEQDKAKEVTIINKIIVMSNFLKKRIGEDSELITCCYCNDKATGRVVFMNAQGNIVDNPFCGSHEKEVYDQTHRGLREMHHLGSVRREFTKIQRWLKDGTPPEMPKDQTALLSTGNGYYH